MRVNVCPPAESSLRIDPSSSARPFAFVMDTSSGKLCSERPLTMTIASSSAEGDTITSANPVPRRPSAAASMPVKTSALGSAY